MGVRSDRLWGPEDAFGGTGGLDLFTVPQGETWLVKSLVVARAGLVDPNFLIVFLREVPSDEQDLIRESEFPPNGIHSYERWWAFDPGCRLRIYVSPLAGQVVTSGWGAKLAGHVP